MSSESTHEPGRHGAERLARWRAEESEFFAAFLRWRVGEKAAKVKAELG